MSNGKEWFVGFYSDCPPVPKSAYKICPSCGWHGETTLLNCYRKEFHNPYGVVTLNLVPPDKMEALQ